MDQNLLKLIGTLVFVLFVALSAYLILTHTDDVP